MFPERTSNLRAEFLTRERHEGQFGNPDHLTAVEKGEIDPQRLLELPGARAEHETFADSPTGRHSQTRWDELVESVRERGVESPIFVVVEPIDRTRGRLQIHRGPQIIEGNHRARAAVEAGVATVPVLIRYFGRSEARGWLFPDVPREPALKDRLMPP